jgi:ATP-dependent protease ClpP protease subunit
MPMELPEWLKLIKGSLDDGDEEVDLLMCEPVGYDPETYTGMSSRRFGEILAYVPKKKKINLQLNTLGGFVNEGVAMHNLIVARGNVDVVVIGYAASMGAIIMQAGQKRTMMPGTMVLIHPVAGGTDTDEGKKIKEVLTKNLVDILAKRTGNRRSVIAKLMEETCAMGPEEAKKMGFCDEIGEGAPATNSVDALRLFNTFQQLAGATNRVGSVGKQGGEPANEEQQDNTMKELLKLLAKLKLVGSADVTEDQAIAQLEAAHAALLKEATDAKNELKIHADKAASDLKNRVETKVKNAVTAKLIKPEREAGLIAAGMANEAALDFIADLQPAAAAPATTPARRGAPPVPPEKKEGEENQRRRGPSCQAP